MPKRHPFKCKIGLPAAVLLLVNIVIHPVSAQTTGMLPWTDVVVTQGSDTLIYAWAGGLDNPQFYQADFTGNGQDDLMVFDREGGRVLLFGWNGSSWDWLADPPVDFPNLRNWVVPLDYNCDGVTDLLSDGQLGYTRLLRGVRKGGRLQFQTATDTVMYSYPQGYFFLGVDQIDVPGVIDVNGDGDVDILNFDPSGGYLLYFENQSIEQHGVCDTLILKLESECWGEFYETGINKTLKLDTCRPDSEGGGEPGLRHAGSTVAPFDINRDGLMDVILGDLNFSNLNLLINGGTTSVAKVVAQDTAFPMNDIPADLDVFPGSFIVDTDMDGRTDVVAAPNFVNGSFNRDQVWRYVDQVSSGASQFERQDMDWLQSEMIEAGGHTAPAMMDTDGDGLLDIILGGGEIREPGGTQSGGLLLLTNTGTGMLPAFDLVNMDYGGVRGFGLDNVAPALGDIDDDGDLDMLIGESTGKLHLLTNNGQPGGPAQFGSFSPIYMGIDVGSNSTPCFIDLNEDGLLDLIVGEKNGNLNYFENTGTKQQAQFVSTPDDDFLGQVDVRDLGQLFGYSAPTIWQDSTGKKNLVVGNLNGQLHYYPNIGGNVTGIYTAQTEMLGGLDVGAQSIPSAADLDGDKQMELLVGTSRGGVELFNGDPTIGIRTPEPMVDLRVYPNPADNQAVLQSNQEGQFRIFAMDGRLMLEGRLEPGKRKSIYSNDWPSGVYLITISGDQYHATQKLVICH